MTDHDAALTRVEAVIAEIWSKLLGCPVPTRNSDFFGLGGDSLQMLNMLFCVKEVLSADLPPGTLFEHSSLEAFSRVVEQDLVHTANVALG